MAVRPINMLSICTGGGGLDLGIELALPCARSVCLVEREAFAVAHLVAAMQQGLLDEAPVWSDARTFDGRPWRGAVDGLIGGIPCQPHSLAGKRLEREDPRDLWSTARRILVQSGAWFVLIENVEGMLSSGGAERVWRDLGRLGFACEVGLFTAAEVGASHKRERTFILGVADAVRERGRGGQSRREDAADADAAGERVVNAPRLGRGEGRPEPSLRSGRHAAGGAGIALGDADGARCAASRCGPDVGAARQPEPGCGAVGVATGGNGASLGQPGPHHAEAREREHRRSDGGLFPPGPGDIDGWRDILARAPELEPAVRKLAHELDAGVFGTLLDRTRVDQLRLLGNGVVPLQAALAIRVLSSRLAQRGSRGAAFISTMIENNLKQHADFGGTPC